MSYFYTHFREADFFNVLNHLLLHAFRRAVLLLWPSAMQISFAAFPPIFLPFPNSMIAYKLFQCCGCGLFSTGSHSCASCHCAHAQNLVLKPCALALVLLNHFWESKLIVSDFWLKSIILPQVLCLLVHCMRMPIVKESFGKSCRLWLQVVKPNLVVELFHLAAI